jgi:hypothetical protein
MSSDNENENEEEHPIYNLRILKLYIGILIKIFLDILIG